MDSQNAYTRALTFETFCTAPFCSSDVPLFTDVSPECLQEIVNSLILMRVSAGEHIMRAGEVGDSMYFINQGHVSVRVDGGEIDRLTTGDLFGEVALVMVSQRIADVVSLGRSHRSVRRHTGERQTIGHNIGEDIVLNRGSLPLSLPPALSRTSEHALGSPGSSTGDVNRDLW